MNDRIYPAQTTALVLIDVLNDFLADDGKLHASIAPMLDKTGFVAHVAQLLEHRAGVDGGGGHSGNGNEGGPVTTSSNRRARRAPHRG